LPAYRQAWQWRARAWCHREVAEIVERVVTVEVPVVRIVTEQIQLPAKQPRGAADWASLLGQLTRQLDTGRIYPRDLDAVTDAVNDVVAAINRRVTSGRR
jgi:hypothetical protein